MTTKKYDQFSNFPEGYAEAQLQKLRNIRHRLYPDWVTANDRKRERDQRITQLETFNEYQQRQRVGGVK